MNSRVKAEISIAEDFVREQGGDPTKMRLQFPKPHPVARGLGAAVRGQREVKDCGGGGMLLHFTK